MRLNLWLSVFIAALFFAAIIIGISFADLPRPVFAVYFVFSLISFIAFGLDKRAALRGDQRHSEASLLTTALVGGWPGALIARHLFRHKTQKRGFRIAFWGAVGINLGVLIWLFQYNGLTILQALVYRALNA